MSDAPQDQNLHQPTEDTCRDGKEHDWRKVSVGDSYSYYFCQMCGREKGRPQNPPTQCPP